MKKKQQQSEYLERYGLVVSYPEKALNLVGTEIQYGAEGKEKKYLVEKVRFSDIKIQKEGKGDKLLSVEFLLNNFKDEPFWSQAFPTEIEEPKKSEIHDEFMLDEMMNVLKETIKNEPK